MSAIPVMLDEPRLAREDPVPPVPDTLADTGLSADVVRDLILKVSTSRGGVRDTSSQISCGSPSRWSTRSCSPCSSGGLSRSGEPLALTERVTSSTLVMRDATGRRRLSRPASMSDPPQYHWRSTPSGLKRSPIQNAHVTQETLQSGFSHLVLNHSLLDILGPAVNSSKSIFLYGHPGNGKTAIAEAISQMLGGILYLPYAVDVDGQIMLVFDPVHHQEVPVEEQAIGQDSLWLRSGSGYDRRFARVKRPVVITGGELTLEQLDLRYDHFTKLYQAPFQVKANGGVLIVDDFGRQRVPPRDLLNRWIVPLEKHVDYLTLHTGGKFPVPFDCLLIFATNLDPAELVEEAFLRRIHYKIPVEDPTRDQYDEIFRRCCQAAGVAYTAESVTYVFDEFYDKRGIRPRGCHPRDLIAHVTDIAKYREIQPELTADLLDRACRSYFLESGPA